MISQTTLRATRLSSRGLLRAKAYKPLLNVQIKSLSDLRGSIDDPNKQLINGMYGGRILQEKHEASYPHLNVLEILERPDERLDLAPVLGESSMKKLGSQLFAAEEDALAAIEMVKGLKKVQDWTDVSEELETSITKLADLKEGESVVILGAGISGLSLAWILARARPDLKIKVLEEKREAGGWMSSEQPEKATSMEKEAALFEWGPRTLQASHSGSHLLRLILTEMGLSDKISYVGTWSKANRKGLLFEGKPYQLPTSNSEILKFLGSKISAGVKLAPLKDLLARARPLDVRDESVGSYVSRRFGKVASERFVSAVMRGIYGSDVDELSARSAARIGKIYALEHESPSMLATMINGSGTRADKYAASIHSLVLQAILEMPFEDAAREMTKYSVAVFGDGIQWLPKTLAQKCRELPNIEILMNNKVTSISNKSQRELTVNAEETTLGLKKAIDANLVVSTLPGYSVAPLLEQSAPQLGAQIEQSLEYTTMGVVNVNIPHKSVGQNWFGYLVPKSEKNPEELLGVIYNTAVRHAAYPAERIPLPHPFETIKLDQKDRQSGESLLDNFDADKFADEHERRVLLTDTLERRPETPLPDHSNITLMLGGHLWDGQEVLPSKAEIIARTYGVFEKHMNCNLKAEKDVHIEVRIHKNCIPKYTVGHRERMQGVKDSVSRTFNNRLFLCGTSFGRGVGIGDCVVDSFSIASRYSDERKLVFPRAYLNNWLGLSNPSTLV